MDNLIPHKPQDWHTKIPSFYPLKIKFKLQTIGIQMKSVNLFAYIDWSSFFLLFSSLLFSSVLNSSSLPSQLPPLWLPLQQSSNLYNFNFFLLIYSLFSLITLSLIIIQFLLLFVILFYFIFILKIIFIFILLLLFY